MAFSKRVSVFWDYENCALPSNTSGFHVVQNIHALAEPYGSITIFKAYTEISKVPSKLRAELQQSGVTLTDCPHDGKKDVADKMMIVDMMAYAIDQQAPATLILVTGDGDFSYAISVLRSRKYRIVLVTPSQRVHRSLKFHASVIIDWSSEILGKGSMVARPMGMTNGTAVLPVGGIPNSGSIEAGPRVDPLPALYFPSQDNSPPRFGTSKDRVSGLVPLMHPMLWHLKEVHNLLPRSFPRHLFMSIQSSPLHHLQRMRVTLLRLSSIIASTFISFWKWSSLREMLDTTLASPNKGPASPDIRAPENTTFFGNENMSTTERLSLQQCLAALHTLGLECEVKLNPLSPLPAQTGIPRSDKQVHSAGTPRFVSRSDVRGPVPSYTPVLISPSSTFPRTDYAYTDAASIYTPEVLEKPASLSVSQKMINTISSHPAGAVRSQKQLASQKKPTNSSGLDPPPSQITGVDAAKSHAEIINAIPIQFRPLVEHLEHVYSEGWVKTDHSSISSALSSQMPKLYKQTRVTEFKSYIEQAIKASVVVAKSDGLSLHPNLLKNLTGAKERAATNEKQSSLVPPIGCVATKSSIVPPGFQLLIDRLERLYQNDVARPFRDLVWVDLLMQDQQVFRKAGVQTFDEYVAKAKLAGIIKMGGEGSKTWMSLQPSWHLAC